MQRGEVVVLFYDKLESLRQVLQTYSAQPVQSINSPGSDKQPRRARDNRRRPAVHLGQARPSNAQPHL
jgi:hypothetical protein